MADIPRKRAALIGLGMVSKTYADAIANSRSVQLAQVFARRPESRQAFLDAHPGLGAAAAESVEAIAENPGIDFVVVTTPPNARAQIVETLARAGKPILMEKPVERSLEAATGLVEMCEAANVPLGIVLQHRARPVVGDLRRLMPDLGTLVAAEVNVPWWRPQAYYDEPGRGTYARDGGGVLISQAIHTLDLMLSFTGPVSEVTAMAATTGFHRMEAEDFVCAGLRFAGGAAGQLFATTSSFPGRGETVCLHFTHASARLAAGVLQIDWQDGQSETFGKAAASGAGADPMAFTSDWHRFILEDFAAALSDARPPLVPGRAALEVHRLIDAIERSARQGRQVSVSNAT
ncbi:MAG: Gfo/Idh/MocA family oxidoreductase [Rhodobacter sp.]|nr:Gfo/Idh/MocA family oxidoreductase [Rhodobacter sp.]